MSRATSLADLYRASVQEYTKSPAEWKGLLSCVARFYKRSFDNAVLIYAQKPDATQLGTFDEWHDRRIGRSVNRGAKGIAVIDMDNPGASIKYLFDFMDTNGSVQSCRNLQRYLWELEEQYRPGILMRFHEKYNTPVSDMEFCLYQLVSWRVEDLIFPYMRDFQIGDETSPLHGMPEAAVKAEFTGLVEESAAYTVFSKCGLSTEMFGDDSFENIGYYNSLPLFMALGNWTVSVARSILNEIYREIQAIKIERSKIYENRTLMELHIQTGSGRDAVSGDQNIGESADRSNAGGTVRKLVERIHERETSSQTVGTGGRGQNQRSHSSGGQGGGAAKRGTDSGTVDRSSHTGYGGHNGESQVRERNNEGGRRDRNGRGGTQSQVAKEPPSASQSAAQAEILVESERPVTKAGFSDEDESFEIMDAVLCADDLIPDAKVWHSEIYGFFRRDNSRKKKADALRLIYKELDVEYTIREQNEQVHVRGQSEGIVLREEGIDSFFSYQDLSKRIDIMIQRGVYPFSMREVTEPEAVSGRQLSLFDRDMEVKTGYGDRTDSSRDAVLSVEEMQSIESTGKESETFQAIAQTAQKKEAHDRVITEALERRGNDCNYRYLEEHHLYDGGPKTKFRNNVAAIRLLQTLQEQDRRATAEEQITLAKYVGWGGLAGALTPGKSGWEKEYEEIKSLLTETEFQAAQESTLTAYYTEQSIIRNIYRALERFGFRGGNILDPAMATGNFFSVLPESMANSKLYGVEIEPISGHIAKHLYPQADIQVMGFEQTSYPDQFFDVVVGNIPFHSIRVDDPKYNRYHFRIHDYFLAKSLDKLRPGGMMAVITSKYTMDKRNSSHRKYLAQRARLLGAIRLPDNAFRRVAGTETTVDILFLMKREREIVPDEENSTWLSVEKNEDNIPINSWFIEHPEMVLGTMVFDESMYGNEKSTACHPIPEDDLNERLERAVGYLEGKYEEPPETDQVSQMDNFSRMSSLPADPGIRNFSYALVEGRLYYREYSRMYEQEITGRKAERIKGLVKITQAVRKLIDFQNQQQDTLTVAMYEAGLQEHISELNTVYDRFVEKHGYINTYANVAAFARDANAPLLRSIEKEKKDEKGVYEKTAVFYKATIRPGKMPTVVDSAQEALKVSLNSKGRIDLDYMTQIYQKADHRMATKDEIIEELGEQIYQDPILYVGDPYAGWQTAGEYLSGYVKDKLAEAVLKAQEEPERFTRNVEALRAVQPVPLTPQEISFSLGSPWIPLEIYQTFMYETFKTQEGNKNGRFATQLEFSRYSGVYFIAGKGNERGSVTADQIYGTERMSAYEILETSLNLRFAEVKDRVEYVDPDTGEDKVKYVLNKKETILAREKQAQIKAEFERWLFADPERGTKLTKLYNDRFNNIRPRKYDGSALVLPDLSADIKLRPHQLDVVAHGLYGDGNLLMAHEVGAGKTYAAIVLAHELKRLGKAAKPLIAVPNHLVGQWSDAYMELYPGANILVAQKRDFQKQNRRRFVSRIATGEYDCIIMAHSSFELIGLSRERQLMAMKKELDTITQAIDEQKSNAGKDWSLKQMQIFRKNLQYRYDQLFQAEKKDTVINFEELGVDTLIVDEAHAYKNNFSYTKMRNVAGISGRSSQRAMDMYQKCQYINEISGGKGVIYLTGTPVSNSMAELYVMQKTLQPGELERRGLLMFDAWAGTFGKITSALEIRPEGNGYQMKNRFAQFHNLPELMRMFSMIADIKTADMLGLPTPELKTGAPQVIKSVCTPGQKRIVMELAERAEAIRSGMVDSSEDNFLKLTHEARLVSIDPRAIDPEIRDDPHTKLNLCAQTAAKIYQETAKDRLTQLIFCDQGTPKYRESTDRGDRENNLERSDSFNFYEATKAALIEQGVKSEEIAFIHDARTDVQRQQLFDRVREGEIRILMGSTEKMGTGMNVQEKLIALHHLDVPWRPADLTQRNGRILRQGNENREVSIFNYITENTFDSYLWQILEQKQRYISQIMTGRSALRTCEDLDETVLQYAEFKALATSDPRVKEKMETDNEINRLTVLKSSWQSQQADLQDKVSRHFPMKIARKEKEAADREKDIASYRENKMKEFRMEIDGRVYEERTKAAEHLMVCGRRIKGGNTGDSLDVGLYAGFCIRLVRTDWDSMSIQLCGKRNYSTDYGESGLGNITRIENLAEHIVLDGEYDREELANLRQQFAVAREAYGKPFPDEERLLELQKKKVQLDLALEFKGDGEDVIIEDETENSRMTEGECIHGATYEYGRNGGTVYDTDFDLER